MIFLISASKVVRRTDWSHGVQLPHLVWRINIKIVNNACKFSE
jgi:hypothetical protein